MASIDEIANTMTVPNTKKGFIDLPRELRDEIYDLALEHDRTTTKDGGTMHLHVRAPEKRLRLVSKQFALEYYDRSPPKNDIRLSVAGNSPTIRLQSAGGFTYAVGASAVDVTLTFESFDDSLYTYVDHLFPWLSKLVEDMPYVETIRIKLCFSISPNLKTFDWFSRAVHRASPYAVKQIQQFPGCWCNTKPITLIDKMDLMVVLPKFESNNAVSTGSELGKIGSWTLVGGYQVDADFAELRRKYGGS